MNQKLFTPRGLAATIGVGAALTATSFAMAATGTPDATFSGDGVVELFKSGDSGFYGSDPVSTLDAQGRTVVAQVDNRGEGGSLNVWRVLPDGSVDPSFNGGESSNLAVRYPDSRGVQDVRVVGDRIVVVISEGDDEMVLFRLEADGTPDEDLSDDWRGDGARVLGSESDGKDACDTLRAHIGADGGIRAFWSCTRLATVRARSFDADGDAVGEVTTFESPLFMGWGTDAGSDDAGHDRVLFGGLGEFAVVDEEDQLTGAEGTADALTVDEGGAFAVAGAESAGTWALRAYQADGTARPGFGTEGEVVVENPELGTRDAVYNGDFLVWERNGVSHVRSTPGGGLLAVGAEQDRRGRSTPDGWGSATVRVTASGAPDTGWGAGGVKVLAYDGPQPLDFRLAGPPAFDAAARATIPVAVPRWQPEVDQRRGAAGVDNTVRLLRIGDPPVKPADPDQPQTETQQQQPSTSPPATKTSTTVASTARKTARTCLSRRSFTIRLRPRSLKSATVRVAGKKVATTRKDGRLTAKVDLRKLRQATFTVKVSGRTAKGRRISETRTYRTCRVGENGPKVKGGSIVITVG